MDNLTHTLTGVMLARAGFGRLTPRATWIAAIAANAPDVDFVTMAFGLETYFEYHRAHTHAILFLPLVALLPVLIVAAISRKSLPWFRAWILSLIGVASHLLLDLTNIYGIRLYLPFSDRWPALDITHVFDLWIWAILLIAFLWPLLSGLVGSEIGASEKPKQGIAVAALLLLLSYDVSRYVLHQRAIAALDSRLYDGAAAKQVMAKPGSVNPMRWDGWVETEKAWLHVEVDLTKEFDPEPIARYWKVEPTPAMQAARQLPLFEVMSRFARTPHWRVLPAEALPGAYRVELIDLRFGGNGRLGFTVSALIDESGRGIESRFQF